MKTVAALCFISTLFLFTSLWGAGPQRSPVDEFLDLMIADGRSRPNFRPLGELIGQSAALSPQDDGVVYLNVEAAAILRWNGKQAALVNGASAIRIADGTVSRWDGENERLTWRVHLPASRSYRVVINRQTTAGQVGSVAITFIGAQKRSLIKPIEQSADPSKFEIFDVGKIDLKAGELLVELAPTSWISPFAFSRLADVRLIPLDGPQPARAEAKVYKKAYFPTPAPDAAARKTLFPTGHFEQLPKQPIDEKLPPVHLAIQPPPDAAHRLDRFSKRNSDEKLGILCHELQSVLIAGTPGLEQFEKLCQAGKPREALEAYRAYFFAKLADPEKHGAVADNILFDLTRDRGKGELLLHPGDFVIDKNLHNTAVAQINKELVLGEVGPPGAVSWVPYGLKIPESAANSGRSSQDPFFQTPAGKQARRTLEFYRYLSILPADREEYFAGGLFPALLWSYAITGNKTHLARWSEYIDDWQMNATRDQDDFPFGIRNAMDLETQLPRCMLNLLRITLDEQPEMARDFEAPTLARLMLKLVSDYAPYVIRCRRAEMANWGIMGICHQLHLCRFLHEFKAMDYFNREAWRLWNANMIQHRTLDGENFEAWDEGHNWIDIEYSIESVPFAKLPPGTDDLNLISFWDDVRADERGKLVHLSPLGNYWPFWEASQPRGKTMMQARYHSDASGRNQFDLIDNEAEAKSRLETVMAGGKPPQTPLPCRLSDVNPYAAMSYLRESWQSDAGYLILQNFRDRSQTQDNCSRTMFTLSKADRILIEAHGLAVDRKPDNRYQDKLMTGGKTEYCGAAGRHVFDERFHTSAKFDFAEAMQDAPYAHHRRSVPDVFGLYKTVLSQGDPAPIRDVTVLRQIFGVRGEGLWITCDRVKSTSAKEHEYTQFYALPVRISESGFADRVRDLATSRNPLIEENERKQCIRTANPGFDNLSIYCFAPAPLKFANTLSGKGEHEISKTSAVEDLAALLKSGRRADAILKQPIRWPVSVRWSGVGNQVFVSALYTLPVVIDSAGKVGDDVREIHQFKGDGGVVGCKLITRTGAQVWFQSGPNPVNSLTGGSISAAGESLLVTTTADGATSGIVLGCASFAPAGHPCNVPAADFEFAVNSKSEISSFQPIHRPIDTVRILPAHNVFTDRVDVSFDIATQKTNDIELHYTLDGSDPTLNSALYAAPVTLDNTTLVKVRPFRKGLATTPWNVPGIDAGKTIDAIFRKVPIKAAMAVNRPQPGLSFSYFEDNWATLFSYAGYPDILRPKTSGDVASLLAPHDLEKLRTTERAFAVRYDGLINVPVTGVYSFHSPPNFATSTMDVGYDLRVFIDGEEWLPTPRLHAENTWSTALQAGMHRFSVAYVDYRWKKFRNEYWMAWQEEEMFTGTPVLEVSGPGIARQPIPAGWLWR